MRWHTCSVSVGRSTESLVGSELAGYRIEALIGRGGMGAVYRAQEAGLERKVALKVIAPELAQDARFRDRFLRESQIAASLDHPHVIPIYQAGEKEGVLYLAMRYVEGTDLAKLVAQEGALEPKRALDILSQVAEALDAAHAKGLVHRDVKPSNVLIAQAADREHCYLADFGLTKRTASLSGVSAMGQIVGTLEYVAPEQITGEPLDARSDVYSLGCVLYECLTGQAPFPRATDVALLWAHVHEEPTPPSKAKPELPRELDTVLARALAKEPARRYRSAGELVAATRSALGIGEAVAPPKRFSRVLLAGVAVLALALVAGALAFFLRSDSGGLSAISPNAVGVIDPEKNELVAEVPVGARPGPVIAGEGAVWVANLDDETVSRIDPETRQVVRTVPAGGFPSDIAVGEGSVWVLRAEYLDLTKIAPEFTEIEHPPVKNEDGLVCGTASRISNLAVGGGRAWITCALFMVARLDLGTGRLNETTIDTGGTFVQQEFTDIAVGLGSAWVVNRATNTVIQIEPSANQGLATRAVTVGRSPYAIAAGEGALWVANREDDTVSRIDVRFGDAPAVTAVSVGDGPVDVAVGEDAVWVANSLGGTVSRIDPETNEVVATIEVGARPQHIAAGEGAVWVTLRGVE